MTEQQRESAEQKLRQAYDKSEKRVSRTSDELVATQGFTEALAMLPINAVAMSRVMSTGLDQVVKTTRLAGQRDINRLARQLNRTEDKLEQVLQVVEQLEEELAATRAERDESRRETRPVETRAKRTAATTSVRSSAASSSTSGRGRGRGRSANVTNGEVTSADVTNSVAQGGEENGR